jgi:hypothetical protein
MSMPIQRQSEAFGVFDDGPRFARDRGSHDLPRGLAGLVNSMGPRITGGLLDTRTAAPQADAGGATSGDAMSALTNYGIEPPTMNVGGGVSTSIPGAVAKMVWNGSSTTGQEATPAFNPGPAKTGGWHSDFDPSARLRIRRAGMECEYCGKPGHDWTRHPEAHADVAAWEREKHLEEFPFGDYTESPYPADDEHGGEAWPGRNASRRTAGDGPGPGGVDDLMFPNHRQPTGADYLAEMEPEDRPGYGEDGSGWCKHCEETITEKGMGYAHYDGHNRIGEPNYYESDHPAEPEDDDDDLDDGYPAYRPSTARRAGYPSDGPRDHGGAGPDGGPSVPDWYYQDDDDFDGDPKDPPGTPMEDPWGHGGRRASRHPFDRAAAARLAKDGCRRKTGARSWHPSGLGGGNREAPAEYVFDWRDDSMSQEETDGVDHMTPEEFDAFTNHVWRADLENGHSLHIQEDDPSLTGYGKREYFPTIHHPGDPTGNLHHPDRPGEPSEETGLGKWFKSRAKAQRAIERAYMEKYPIGSDAPARPPRDSGVNYESLVNPSLDLGDEDYGHILGGLP